jgi:hypothetical protein
MVETMIEGKQVERASPLVKYMRGVDFPLATNEETFPIRGFLVAAPAVF